MSQASHKGSGQMLISELTLPSVNKGSSGCSATLWTIQGKVRQKDIITRLSYYLKAYHKNQSPQKQWKMK